MRHDGSRSTAASGSLQRAVHLPSPSQSLNAVAFHHYYTQRDATPGVHVGMQRCKGALPIRPCWSGPSAPLSPSAPYRRLLLSHEPICDALQTRLPPQNGVGAALPILKCGQQVHNRLRMLRLASPVRQIAARSVDKFYHRAAVSCECVVRCPGLILGTRLRLLHLRDFPSAELPPLTACLPSNGPMRSVAG